MGQKKINDARKSVKILIEVSKSETIRTYGVKRKRAKTEFVLCLTRDVKPRKNDTTLTTSQSQITKTRTVLLQDYKMTKKARFEADENGVGMAGRTTKTQSSQHSLAFRESF